jgi:DNA-directed RNA polymerase subunit RPC12/RpoP
MLRSPGHDLRTCTECGERAAFTLDAEGTWFRCTRCGAYA